jgi:hypothetical protein
MSSGSRSHLTFADDVHSTVEAEARVSYGSLLPFTGMRQSMGIRPRESGDLRIVGIADSATQTAKSIRKSHVK